MPGRLHDLDYLAMVDHLTTVRKHVGMTQAELAHRLGRPQSYVSKIERAERRVDVAEWRLIATALNQNPTEMFDEVSRLLDDIELLSISHKAPG